MSTNCPACGKDHEDQGPPAKGCAWPCTGESVAIVIAWDEQNCSSAVVCAHRTYESAERWIERVTRGRPDLVYTIHVEEIRSDE